MPNVCPLCLSVAKTTDHLFIHCPVIWSRWRRIRWSILSVFFLGKAINLISHCRLLPPCKILWKLWVFVSMLLYGPVGRNGISGVLRILRGPFFSLGVIFISCIGPNLTFPYLLFLWNHLVVIYGRFSFLMRKTLYSLSVNSYFIDQQRKYIYFC